MQPDIPLLQQTILFSGIEAEELRHLLTCLGGSVRRYGRGEFLWHAGDTVLQAGIVLQGAVDAVQYRRGRVRGNAHGSRRGKPGIGALPGGGGGAVFAAGADHGGL